MRGQGNLRKLLNAFRKILVNANLAECKSDMLCTVIRVWGWERPAGCRS
jgi:hypothetical protein